MKSERLCLALLFLSALLSCTPQQAEPDTPPSGKDEPQKEWGDTTTRTFTVSLPATKIAYDRLDGYKWAAGDVVYLSNCNSDVLFEEGAMLENPNARMVTVTEAMIGGNGNTISFGTDIPSAPQYCVVAASKSKAIAAISKDGAVTVGELSANVKGVLPFVASCTGEGNDFFLQGNVSLASFTVTAVPVYKVSISVPGKTYSATIGVHPATVYFPIGNANNVSVRASSVSESLFSYTFKGFTIPDDGSVLDLGDLCAFAGVSDYFDQWQAGISFDVAGVDINRNTLGEAVHISKDTGISDASGVYFVDPGAVLTISGSGNGPLAVLSNKKGSTATVVIDRSISGDLAFKDIRISRKSGAAVENGSPAGYELFDHCIFTDEYFLHSSGSTDNLSICSCTFYSEDITTLDLADCHQGHIGNLNLNFNIFYNKLPSAGAYIIAGDTNNASVKGNIVYLSGQPEADFAILESGTGNVAVSDNYLCGPGSFQSSVSACQGHPLTGPVSDPFTRKDFREGIFEYDLNMAVSVDLISEILACKDVEATFNLENRMVQGFVHDFEYDTDYSYTKINEYSNFAGNWQEPLPVTIACDPAVPFSSQFVLVASDDGDLFSVNGKSSSIEIYNLKPGKTYSYGIISSSDKRILRKGAFATEGTVRQIKTERIRNVRDAGGWAGMDGKHVKYGLLFRGAEIKNNSSDLKSIEDEDYRILVNDLGISLDLDLRGVNERGGINWSPMGITYLHLPLSPYYWGITDSNSKKLYAQGIRAMMDNIKKGEATYVHCQAGADRTGTFVFLVNGLLGVSESDLCKDYELTNHYTERSRNSDNYIALVNAVLSHCTSGRDINEGIYNAVLSMGISAGEIEELRNLMLE